MRKELFRHTQARSDDQLYEMLFLHRDDWTPEALEIAEQEWIGRNLDAEKLRNAQAIAAERENNRLALAEEPLSTAQKVTFFIFNYTFCLGIVQAVIADIVFKDRGYDRKFRDCFKWMGYGFLSYCLIYWVALLFGPQR